MTQAEFFFKTIILAADGQIAGNAFVKYDVNVEKGTVTGNFEFPIVLFSENGELSIKTSDWLKADFSSVTKEV